MSAKAIDMLERQLQDLRESGHLLLAAPAVSARAGDLPNDDSDGTAQILPPD